MYHYKNFRFRPATLFMGLVLCYLAFVTASCTPEEVDPLSEDIRNLVPDSIMVKIIDLGISINEGRTPPQLEGVYAVSPLILSSSSIASDVIGRRYADFRFKFYDQNQGRLTISLDSKEYSTSSGNLLSSSIGDGAFLAGEGNKFTAFISETSFEPNGDERSKTITIYSGEITEAGIENFQFAIVMLDNLGNSGLIANGEGRVFIQGESGTAERWDGPFRMARPEPGQVELPSILDKH